MIPVMRLAAMGRTMFCWMRKSDEGKIVMSAEERMDWMVGCIAVERRLIAHEVKRPVRRAS